MTPDEERLLRQEVKISRQAVEIQSLKAQVRTLERRVRDSGKYIDTLCRKLKQNEEAADRLFREQGSD